MAMLSANSRTMSSMITGPSNFPTRSNQKKLNTAQKRTEEMLEYRERALKAIRKKLRPELAPIQTGQSDAVELLQKKLDKRVQQQELMKAANKAIRSKKDVTKKLLDLGLSQKVAEELQKPDFVNRLGFASFELTNNNAEIKRLKDADSRSPEAAHDSRERRGYRLYVRWRRG